MSKSTLTIGGKQFELNYEMLEEIADNIPQNERYQGIKDALIDLNSRKIIETLIDSYHLTPEQMDKIWAKDDFRLRRKLVEESSFIEHLSEKQASDIMEMDDPCMLVNVAKWSEYVYDTEDNERSPRLSPETGRKLLAHMANHRDEAVRRELAENTRTSPEFYPGLEEAVRFGSGHCNFVNIKQVDIKLLDKASSDLLENLAKNVQLIADEEAKNAIAEWLAEYPDPFVRIALAKNELAPVFILKKMLADQDADVAGNARETLEKDD